MKHPFTPNEKMKRGCCGLVLFVVLLFLHSSAFQSSSLSRSPLSTSRIRELAERTQMELIREDIERIAVVRVPDTPPHRRVQRYIIEEIQNYPHWAIDTHRFVGETPLGEKEFTNIIATWSPLPQSNPRFSKPENEKRVVLAAHYDSKLFDFEFLAATDSAVSCALLLDVIKTLNNEFEHYATHKSAKINTQLSLQIVFFDGEEAFIDWTATDSIYGSRKLSEKWKEADEQFKESTPGSSKVNRKREGLENIELFILLDLIGARNPIPQFRSYFDNTREPYLQIANVEENLVKHGLYDVSNIPAGRGHNPYLSTIPLGRSYGVDDDHKPFLDKGVKVIHFIPYGFPKVWHSADDNLSAIDYVQVHNWSVLLRTWVAEYFNFI